MKRYCCHLIDEKKSEIMKTKKNYKIHKTVRSNPHVSGSKEILHRISGKFPGGQLTAIMGPSGAGKSTLLDVLSGYRRTGVNGDVFVNGRVRNLNTFRKMSCYITQDDRIQTLLTVLENMQIAADFKLGKTMEPHDKETRVCFSLYYRINIIR